VGDLLDGLGEHPTVLAAVSGVGAAVCGSGLQQSWGHWLAVLWGGPTWGLRDAERAKVRNGLKSILSVPLFDPDNPEGPLLGTLQVDSDLTIQQMEFDRPERRDLAERFADVVALLLKAGR
jgi:hypothetical protein